MIINVIIKHDRGTRMLQCQPTKPAEPTFDIIIINSMAIIMIINIINNMIINMIIIIIIIIIIIMIIIVIYNKLQVF